MRSKKAPKVVKKGSKQQKSITRRTTPLAQNVIVQSKSKKVVTITHREFVRSLIASTTIPTVYRFDLNPTSHASFPWVGHIAENFETYRFTALAAHYVPACSAVASGLVTLAFDYDAADPLMTNRQTILSNQGCKTGPVHLEYVNRADIALLNRSMAVRYITRSSVDPRTSSPGSLYVAFSECSTPTAGELYFEFTIELSGAHAPEVDGIQVEFHPGPGQFVFSTVPNSPTTWMNHYGNETLFQAADSGRSIVFQPPGPGTYQVTLDLPPPADSNTYNISHEESPNITLMSSSGFRKALTTTQRWLFQTIIRVSSDLIVNAVLPSIKYSLDAGYGVNGPINTLCSAIDAPPTYLIAASAY